MNVYSTRSRGRAPCRKHIEPPGCTGATGRRVQTALSRTQLAVVHAKKAPLVKPGVYILFIFLDVG